MNFKSRIILVAIFLIALFSGACSQGEKIIKVAEFPQTPEFEVLVQDSLGPPRPTDQAKKVHIDLGYVWKQTRLFFCPVINLEGRYIGYTGSEVRYIPLKETEVRELAEKAGVTLPKSSPISFWDAWGGKLALLVILPVLGVLGYLWDWLWRYLKGEV